MSIFVSIASYCDPLLRFTVERALEQARHPDQLHFGIVEQAPEATPVPANAGYVRIDPQYARGPCWARAIAQGLYNGADWYFQIDSHMDFDPGWDEYLIETAKALGPRAVLTAYPNPLTFEDGRPKHSHEPGALRGWVRKDATFPIVMFQATPFPATAPVPAIHVSANCLFAAGRVVLDVPYDPTLYFHGEEQSLALRLFTHGWDLFHPPGLPIYHEYVTTSGVRAVHWDEKDDAPRRKKWPELEAAALGRFEALVAGAPLGAYGLGRARTLDDFALYSGIDYRRKRIEPRAYGDQPRRAGYSMSMSLGTTSKDRGKWSG